MIEDRGMLSLNFNNLNIRTLNEIDEVLKKSLYEIT